MIKNTIILLSFLVSLQWQMKAQQREEAPIDSALLSALRDPRERLGLLKLEKAGIDFMNTSDGYIEVGGPYNSVVISPTKGIVTGVGANPDRPHSTSFQRCILHRLADRFSIVRESGTLVDGYIRLVKLTDSRIPKKLLLHLEPSEYNFPVDDAASQHHARLRRAPDPGRRGWSGAHQRRPTHDRGRAAIDRLVGTEAVDLHRVVDHQLRRRQGIDQPWVTAQLFEIVRLTENLEVLRKLSPQVTRQWVAGI